MGWTPDDYEEPEWHRVGQAKTKAKRDAVNRLISAHREEFERYLEWHTERALEEFPDYQTVG